METAASGIQDLNRYMIRTIQKKDNRQVERVIRTCLIEFGANHEGTAWTDPDLGRFSQIYSNQMNRYWVAECNGNIVAGVGIGMIDSERSICELQKMYCLKEYRGIGLAQKLLDMALDYAKQFYSFCYLETLENMTAAQKFYKKNGFSRTLEPVVETEHFACDIRYIKKLSSV